MQRIVSLFFIDKLEIEKITLLNRGPCFVIESCMRNGLKKKKVL